MIALVATGAPALAEEVGTDTTAADSQASATAEAPSTRQTTTVTESVKKDSGTFDTQEDAQKFLDDAKADAAKKDAEDPTATYGVKASGPTQVEAGSHEETTTVKTTDDTEKTFTSKDDAQKYLDEAKSAAEEAGNTFEGNGPTEIPATTKHEGEAATEAQGSEDGFESEDAARQWAAGQTAGYKDTDDAKYTVSISGATNNPTQVEDGKPEPVGDAKTTPSRSFKTREEAEAALAQAQKEHPSTDLRKVTFSDIVAGGAGYIMQPKDGSLTKIDRSLTEYRSIPKGSFIVVKQATWYAVWTPERADKSNFESLSGDNSLGTFVGVNSGFNTKFTAVGSPAGEYWVTQDGDYYVLHVSSADKISHADYGELKTGPTSYTFTKTVQEYKQNYKTVNNWSISYTVTKTPLVQDDSTWKASYTETSTKTVKDYKWQASYEMTKTTTYDVPSTPEKPSAPATPTTPTKPATVTKTSEPKHLAVAKASAVVPQTGDSTNPAVPAAMAVAGVGILAATRRRRTE